MNKEPDSNFDETLESYEALLDDYLEEMLFGG